MNLAVLKGNISTEPELKYTNNGTAVLKFNIAVNTYRKNQEDDVLFMTCNLFGEYAEKIAPHLSKGKPVLVSGKLKMDQWVDANGNKRSAIKLIVNEFEFIGYKKDENPNVNNKKEEPKAPEVDINDEDIPF